MRCYSQWKLADAHPKTPLTIAGHVDADMFWERITYFLDRVIPVANEYKIRMAVIRRIRACLRRGIRAWIACWGRWMG